MLRFNPTVPIKLYYKSTNYVSGQGASVSWLPITSGAYSAFFCEWKGSYGERAMSAEALGIKDSATIRTHFNPEIYSKLRSVQVIVVKNADATAIVAGIPDKNNPNVYELWGGVDNYLEQNQFMEFKVRRYEGV